ncbi:hypothetical protein IDG70_06335, partial [Staphylococcus sp. EG-SA-26]|nr:hypothetical protein [Staphylococcus sp. EG-SA-26]
MQRVLQLVRQPIFLKILYLLNLHGTIALIEEGTPVVGLATQEKVNLSIRGNVKEVVARGAHPCI